MRQQQPTTAAFATARKSSFATRVTVARSEVGEGARNIKASVRVCTGTLLAVRLIQRSGKEQEQGQRKSLQNWGFLGDSAGGRVSVG